MNQVPRVNTQIDYGRNSSKRIGDTVDSLQRHKSITHSIKKKRSTQTRCMECKADVIRACIELLILGNQQQRYFHSLKQPIFWQRKLKNFQHIITMYNQIVKQGDKLSAFN